MHDELLGAAFFSLFVLVALVAAWAGPSLAYDPDDEPHLKR